LKESETVDITNSIIRKSNEGTKLTNQRNDLTLQQSNSQEYHTKRPEAEDLTQPAETTRLNIKKENSSITIKFYYQEKSIKIKDEA